MRDFAGTLCFYVSPHKIMRDIADMLEVFGDREAALVREISKVHQESMRGTLSELLARVNEGVRGELVLVVDGGNVAANESWKDEASSMYESGMSVKDIASSLSERYGLSRNDVKKYIISLPPRQ